MNKKLIILAIMIVLALTLAACATPIAQLEKSQPDTLEQVPVPSETAITDSFVLAKVDHVEAVVGVGSPIPVVVTVDGNFPNTCSQIAKIQQHIGQKTVDLSIFTETKSSGTCIPDSLPFQLVLPLFPIGLEGGDYTVTANGVSATFTSPSLVQEISYTGSYSQITQMDYLSILVGVGSPIPITLLLDGSLPDACSQISEISQRLENGKFDVTVLSQSAPSQDCGVDSLPFRLSIPLNVTGLAEGEYEVSANGINTRFTIPIDPELAKTAAISGMVWHDVCVGEPDTEVSKGCVAIDGGGRIADGIFEPGEPGIAGVQVILAEGECPGTKLETALTDANGVYRFNKLLPGSYCVSIDPEGGPNADLLIPGYVTGVAGDLAMIPVEVGAGEEVPGVYIGWDFMFLPSSEAGVDSTLKDVRSFEMRLSLAAMGREFPKMQALMGEKFLISYWRSEGEMETPEAAIDQFRSNFMVSNPSILVAPAEDSWLLSNGLDPQKIVGPDVKVVKTLTASGLGSNAKGQALFFIAQQPDLTLYWYGMLFTADGFGVDFPQP